MSRVYSSLSELLDHGFDTVIDVRSPAEFAEDHIPGAINLPVLDNEERARVGTMYKQVSPFAARKIGAALVFQNAANHIAGPLAQHPGSWRPLVYCWRGGQRSGSFGWMLAQIGWRSDVIDGGYRRYRRLVHTAMYDAPLPRRVVLLDGDTGTAKTALLHRLAERGVQVLDLEGMARHRGSLLGGLGPQPSQKAFESAIACAMAQMDPLRPVVIEAESNKIGTRIIPPTLWKAMRQAPRIEVNAPAAARASYLARAYDDVLENRVRLRKLLEHLREIRGGAVLARWHSLIDTGDKQALCAALIRDHYDPAYAKSRALLESSPQQTVYAHSLDDDNLTQVTSAIVEKLKKIAFQ